MTEVATAVADTKTGVVTMIEAAMVEEVEAGAGKLYERVFYKLTNRIFGLLYCLIFMLVLVYYLF